MEIHELNNYNGNLDATAFVAVDNTADTGKITYPTFIAPAKTYTDEKTAALKAEKDAEIFDLRSDLEFVNDELGIISPDVYEVTTGERNVAVNIAENLAFELGTTYHFAFSITEAQITATYFWLYNDLGNQLFAVTIPAGQTSVERNYTTSASTPVTAGYITMKVNVANVSGAVEISQAITTRLDTIEQEAAALEAELAQISVSVNKLNPLTITDGKYIKDDGTTGNDVTMFYTDFIPVKEGDRVNVVYDGVNSSAVRFRWLTAYDSQKNIMSNSGRDYSWAYNVPEGVAFVRITLFKANLEAGKLAININAVYPYTAYGDAVPFLEDVYSILKKPFTTLPDYILGGAWYKPLGELSKGYFCMVTDDGRIGMNQYTIPMVLAKGVPCTFAIMSTSEVMADQTNIDIVKNAIANGCSVAQHGGARWTTYTEDALNAFFDAEQAFFDSVGIEVKGAVIPEHYNSKLIFALAGGRYGVVRSGLDGHNFPTVNHYDNYTSGARSNLYGLSSYNIIDKTLADNKAAVDYAIANKKLMIVYIHENGLTEANKAVIEGLLDYVNSTGITAITLGDIPTIL